MAEEKTETPKGAAFTLIIPLDRQKSKTATIHIKDMDENVYMAAKAMFEKNKDFDAVRMILKSLHVGGDPVDSFKDNFVALQTASLLIREFMTPVEGELKKN